MSERAFPSYWDIVERCAPQSLRRQFLPPMKVSYQPNTGMEVGLAIAIEDALNLEGWRTDHEVTTGPAGHVDLMAWLGPVVAVIEVKRINAGPAAVAQLERYLSDVQQSCPTAIGVLAAPSLTATVSALPDDIYFLPLDGVQ